MIDAETWLILARRLEEIRKAREENEQPEVKLEFDAHDQARVVTADG